MKKLFYCSFFLFLSIILFVILKKPQNNLVPVRMILYMLIWVGIVGVIRVFLGFVENKFQKACKDVERISRNGFIIWMLLYGAGLYLVSLSLRANPVTDYQRVYDTALALAGGESVDNWIYFAMWPNNLGTLSILTFCMNLGQMLGFADPYYFVLALNVLQAMLVMWSIYYLAGQIRKNCQAFRWAAVFMFVFWTPVWGYTNAFYSDQLSMGGSIIGVALFCLGIKMNSVKKWICITLAAVLWSLGVFAKVTAFIPLVAIVIVLLLSHFKKELLKEYLVFGLIFMSLFMGFGILEKQFPSHQLEEQFNIPSEYWIALGLLENGTYAHNEDFVNTCFYMENREDRQEFCRQIISENWKNIFNINRMEAKTSVIFGSGEIAPTSLMSPVERNMLWEWFYWEGVYFWKYCCLSTGYLFAIVLLMVLGSLFQMIHREEEALVMQSFLSVFGLFLFLLFWEAQNKQLYNHIPWMTLVAVYGLERLQEQAVTVMSKLWARRNSYV